MDFLKIGDKFYPSGKLKPGETRNTPRSFKFNWKPKGFLIDENTSMTDEDIAMFPKIRIMIRRK